MTLGGHGSCGAPDLISRIDSISSSSDGTLKEARLILIASPVGTCSS